MPKSKVAGAKGRRPAPGAAEPARVRPLHRILLVEDDPDPQVIAAFALRRGPFELAVCGDGRQALAQAPVFRPDLILLDVMLPFMDGSSILKELRQHPGFAATQVIFMTARAQPEELAEYRSLGCIDVIVKPFDPMTLAETVRGLWDRHYRRIEADERGQLAELEQAYLAQLPSRVADIESVAARVVDSGGARGCGAALPSVPSPDGVIRDAGFRACERGRPIHGESHRDLAGTEAQACIGGASRPDIAPASAARRLPSNLEEAPCSPASRRFAPLGAQCAPLVTRQPPLVTKTWTATLDPRSFSGVHRARENPAARRRPRHNNERRFMRLTFLAVPLAVAAATTAFAQTTTQTFSPLGIADYCRAYVSSGTMYGLYEWNGLNCYGPGSPRQLLGRGDPYVACRYLTKTDRVMRASRGSGDSLVCEVLPTDSGIVIPSFYVTHVVYAPPGSESEVSYREGDTVGSTTATSKSWKADVSVKYKQEFSFLGNGGGVTVKVGTSWGNTSRQATDVAVTSQTGIIKSGAGDFVDHASGDFQSHGGDQIWFLVKPRIKVDITPAWGSIPQQVEWSFVQQDFVHYYVYVRELVDPSLMPEGVKVFLDNQGITIDYYQQLLAAHPFGLGKYPNTWMDPARFDHVGTFPYVPPPRPEDGRTRQTFTLTRTTQNTSTEVRDSSYMASVEVEAKWKTTFIAKLDGSLTVSGGMTWTHSTARTNSEGESLGQSFVLAQPPFGYQGPTLVRVYLDKIWKTFVFNADYY